AGFPGLPQLSHTDAVGNGWMTDAQFLNGLALSGILLAPLIIFCTFVGYFGGGPLSAVAMTVGIFLPAFGFSLLLHDRLGKVVENRVLHSFLEGVAAGVVGLIAATTIELAVTLVQRLPSLPAGLLVFVVALAVLYMWKSKMNVVLAVLGACCGESTNTCGGRLPARVKECRRG
ncbi:chromate transporter, partial [Mesorhizobium sp. M5C.F.Ca.IN.020.32.2.1]